MSGVVGGRGYRSLRRPAARGVRRPGCLSGRALTPVDGSGVWLGLVGWFTVRRDGRVFAPAEVGSRKARTVLALLAVERFRVVSPWTIVDVVWPGPGPRRPVENVATLVSRIRAALGSDVVVGGRSGYRLGASVRTDLYDAAQLVAAAEDGVGAGHPERARSFAEPALELLGRGPVLIDHQGAAWTQPAQLQHVELLRRARHAAAQAALAVRDAHAAAAAAQAAIQADPLDEVAYRALLTAYSLAGEPARALTAYEQLRRTLADELGIDPDPATRELHISILQSGRE